MFANNFFDLMNSIVFDTVKFWLDFFIVVELFVEFYNFIFGLINNDDNFFNLFWVLKVGMIFFKELSKFMILIWS